VSEPEVKSKSIAEILGWKYATVDVGDRYEVKSNAVRIDGKWHYAKCSWCDQLPTPTESQMVAWLRAEERNGCRLYDISVWSGSTDQPRDHPHVHLVIDDRYDEHIHGATLREALEAAVRFVHDRQPTIIDQ
jgi:hypothetical protein